MNIIERKLTDGSKVYDLVLYVADNSTSRVTIMCTDHKSAIDLEKAIRANVVDVIVDSLEEIPQD